MLSSRKSRFVATGLGAALAVSTAVVTAPPAVAYLRSAVLKSAASYASAQGYHVGISVYDTTNGAVMGAGDYTGTYASESLIKVFIATRLLLTGRMHGSTEARAYKMVTQSDDAIASAFYGSVGGDGLVNWIAGYYHVAHLGYGPSRAGWWGNTHLHPDGLVRLYAKLKADRRVAPWLLNAMRHATHYGSDGTYQYFGLPSATRGAAIKQGWGNDYEIGSSSDFNTTGFIDHDRYAVAILARGPSSAYGARISDLLTNVARRLLPNGIFPEAPPSVTGLSTHSGPLGGGRQVTVHGTAFTFVRSVYFGTARARNLHVLSPTTLTVTEPAHTRANCYVRVFTAHGYSQHAPANAFLYERAPLIGGLSSTAGPTRGGQVVTVTGQAFTRVTTVLVGGISAPWRLLSGTELRITTPKHAAGTVNIEVRTVYGRSNDRRYSYDAPPTVTGVSPAKGQAAGGDTVTITGTNLVPGTTVTFGGTPSSKVVPKGTSMTAVTPKHARGTVDVVVTTPGGVAKARYTYS
jgi:hypothetical protein